jgi:hypothetical protein
MLFPGKKDSEAKISGHHCSDVSISIRLQRNLHNNTFKVTVSEPELTQQE